MGINVKQISIKQTVMYIDKDSHGIFSIMKITREELQELGSILRQFEYLIPSIQFVSDNEKASMHLFSAKLRFLIIDAMKADLQTKVSESSNE